MEIGIAGLGCAGSYLLRRLKDNGFAVKGFDPKRPDFYIPCGYAANYSSMKLFMDKAGLDFESYVLSRAGSVTFTGTGMPDIIFDSAGLCTFDKNRLEKDMLEGTGYETKKLGGNHDLIVDATGISRSLLGQAESDFTMYTMEYVSETAEHKDFYFRYFPKGQGYFWEFPLGSLYHVGAGSSSLELIRESLRDSMPMKTTGRKIRLKPLFDQMTGGKIIGVGESIGTVSPITGEGIVPSIECADILYEVLRRRDTLDEIRLDYEKSVRKRFSHYVKLYSLLQSYRSGKRVSLKGMTAVRGVSRTMREFGIDFRISRILKYFV